MEDVKSFLIRHTTDCIQAAFKEKSQAVEIVECDRCGGDNGWHLVLDAPEFDFLWHRMSFNVTVSKNRPLTGGIAFEFYDGNDVVQRDSCSFNENRAFGDALERLQNAIWKRICEE